MLQCIKPYACLPPNTTNFKAFFITDWKLTTSFINTAPFSIQSSQRTWQNTHTCMHTLCNDPSMVPNTSWAYIYTRVQGVGFLVSGVRPLMLSACTVSCRQAKQVLNSVKSDWAWSWCAQLLIPTLGAYEKRSLYFLQHRLPFLTVTF